MAPMPVALVTGTSTGIGYATALHLARNGYTVIATMRNLAKAGPLDTAARGERLPLVVRELDDRAVDLRDALGSVAHGARDLRAARAARHQRLVRAVVGRERMRVAEHLLARPPEHALRGVVPRAHAAIRADGRDRQRRAAQDRGELRVRRREPALRLDAIAHVGRGRHARGPPALRATGRVRP